MAERTDNTTASADIGRFLRHSSVYAVGSILNRLGVFLLLPIYTNYLTVSQYGHLEMFYAVAAVVGGILSVGLAHATLRFYFEYEDPQDRREVVSTNLVAATGLGALGALALMPFRESISRWVFGGPGYELGIAIVLITMVLELSTQIGLAYLRARESSGLFLGVVMLRLLLQVVVNTWLVVGVGAGVIGVLVGNAVSVACGWIVLIGYTVAHCGVALRRSKAVPVLRYSYPFLLGTIVAIVSSNIDRVFIRSLLSFEALGLFALAAKFSRLLEELIGLPFSRAYGAFRFSVMHQDNAAELQARIVRMLFATALVAGLGVALFAGDVLTLLSDEAFGGAGRILPLMVVAAIARVITYPLQTGILVRKRTREIFTVSLLTALVYVVASYLMIRVAGLVGAAAALLLAALVGLVATNRASQRHFPVDYEYRRWGKAAVAACCGYAAALPVLGAPLWLGVPVKASVLLLVVAALVRSDVFDDSERELVSGWLRRAQARCLGRHPLAPVQQGGA